MRGVNVSKMRLLNYSTILLEFSLCNLTVFMVKNAPHTEQIDSEISNLIWKFVLNTLIYSMLQFKLQA